jgi:Family of unknown function (DUF6498)
MRLERIRVRLRDDVAAGAIPLELPDRRLWMFSAIFGGMFVMFAGVAWTMVGMMSRHAVRDVFDLMTLLFEGFWLLGWSVAVMTLGALTAFFLFYGESARLQEGRLVYVPRLGPFKVIIDYNLSRVRNVRLESAGGEGKARIRFDYNEGSNSLGDTMPRIDAERLVETIKGAAAAAGSVDQPTAVPQPTEPRLVQADPPHVPSRDAPDVSGTWLSDAALIGANLLPLAGVLFFGWNLATVMVLFWAESAVIGFYTVLKMVIVGKLFAVVGVPFFIGHFGGFMAMHFLFIYALFLRGAHGGPEPGVRQTLLHIFVPLWVSLAGLFISHGVSFVSNFIGRREYEGTTMAALMTAPYNRIMVMQMALIFGGWIIILLKNPVPALGLLVVLKTAFDFSAHRKAHRTSPDLRKT